MKTHYSLSELERYRNRTLPRLSRFRCWFRKCCQLRLRRLREEDELVDELKTALKAMAVPENPKEYQRLYKLIEGKDIEK